MSIHRLFLSLCAILPFLALTHAAPPTTTGPAVGHHAPDHRLRGFVGADSSNQKVVKRNQDGRTTRTGSTAPTDLSDVHGRVVLLHSSPWKDAERTATVARLINDALRSNEDRGIAAIGITAGEPGEEVSKKAERLDIRWPVALVTGEGRSTPYYAPDELGPEFLFLVGRSGEVVWRGDPLGEEKAFLEALDTALRGHDAPVVGRDLRRELAEAQATYYQGDWEKARSSARKLKKKYTGMEDRDSKAIARDANHLADLVYEHERDLRVRAREAIGKRKFVEFLAIQEAVERGFKRTDLPKEVKEISKVAFKGMVGTMFNDAERWMKFQDARPVLFPARKSGKGDRFAKKLKSFVQSSPHDFAEKKLAKRMLEDYTTAR